MEPVDPGKLSGVKIMGTFRAFLFDKRTQIVLRILIAAIFILSSSTKLFHPAKLADSIDNYRIVPDLLKFTIMPAAYIIPWLQLICAIMILIDLYARTSALILSGLLAFFTVAIAQAWARKIEIECGCFDMLIEWGEKVGSQAVIRDLLFLSMTLAVFFAAKDGLNFYGLFKKK